MFTIKHISSATGTEYLYQGHDVRYQPGSPSWSSPDGMTGQTGAPSCITVDGVPITGGTAFVMNEAGKTIAKYDLDLIPSASVGVLQVV